MNTSKIYQRHTLQASERLKLRKQIEMLFQSGEAFSVYPLLIKFRFVKKNDCPENERLSPVRVGFSIPKKRVRHAHNRNRNRRLLKEAWRCQKQILYQDIPEEWQLHCFVVFKGSEMLTFEQAKATVETVQHKLAQKASLLFEKEKS